LSTELSAQKLRGGYYTPEPIADFLARWAVRSQIDTILEPSCGDGIIIGAAAKALLALGAPEESLSDLLYGVEFNPGEAAVSANRLKTLGVRDPKIHVGDFFAHCQSDLFGEKFLTTVVKKRRFFDVVIGNPPFIRYQNFPEEHRQTAFRLMQEAGLRPNRLTNTWVPFLVVTSLLLKPNGRLAMVIPAELFQVYYAADVRLFLSEYYRHLTIITFEQLVFEGIQQEVVLLLGERNDTTSEGIRLIKLKSIEDLKSFDYQHCLESEIKPMDHSKEKWTQYYLSIEEILLLRELRKNSSLTLSGKVIDVDVGIVTGDNTFFILTEEKVKKLALEPYLERVVARSGHLHGAVFSGLDWQENVETKKPAYFFTPPNLPYEELPTPVQEYIKYGELHEVHKGFKCSNRPRWYIVPSVWIPDAFMLRQIHGYPKLILNDAQANCTDTIHRVRFLNGADRKTVAVAFLNSLTFAFAEVTGRSYGGGVLTFEPSEAEKLPIPLKQAENLEFDTIDRFLREGNITAVLDITDKVLLTDGLGLETRHVKMLRQIWEKLRNRRINRK